MSAYPQVASAFSQINISENNLLTEAQIIRALDFLARRQGLTEYDRNVAEQLWAETQKQNGDKVYVRDFIGTIVRGQALVKESINKLENSIHNRGNVPQNSQQMQDLASYSQDLKYLTVPFGIQNNKSTLAGEASRLASPANRSGFSGNSTVIFAKQIPQKQSGSSTDLKFALLLCIILTCVEIIIMFHKHHFFSLLAYLVVFAVYFLGYFDLHYVRFLMINLFVSTLFDVAWLVVMFGQYWSPQAETQHSSLQWAYYKLLLLLVVVLAGLKIVLAAIFVKYRNNPSNLRKTVSFFGTKYNLSGAPVSPIARFTNPPQSSNNFDNNFNNHNPSTYSHYEQY